ncbi:hypothetical protein ACLKA7_008660 [Drosophila subpalustris]
MKYFLIITSILLWCMTIAVANNTPYPCTHFPNVTCQVPEARSFQKIGQKYYLIGKSKVSWFHSLQLCRRFGGDLVSIESSEEMDALSSYLKSKGHDGNDGFWTSGNDFVVNHHFVSLTSGMPLSFTAWSPGQPDLPESQGSMSTLAWCQFSFELLFRMKYFLFIISTLSLCICISLAHDILYPYKPTLDVTCVVSESKTYQRIGRKYYFIGKSKVTWFDSLHLCRRFGGDLALIESAEEMDTLSSHLKSKGYDGNAWFWTAGNDLVVNHHFMSVTNGLPMPFTSWSAGQPDYPGVEHCVHLWLRDGEFRMNNWVCTEKAYYMCQRQNDTRCSEDVYRNIIDVRSSASP